MTHLVKKTFSINLRVLRAVGLYPPKKYNRLYKVYSYIIYFTLIVPTPILTLLFLLLDESVNLELVAQNAFAVAETGCFVFKLLQFIKNADSYTKEQGSIIDDCVKICTRNSNFFLFFCILTAISWAVVPLFGTEYKLPLDLWLPFDITSGGLPYNISYIVLVLGVSSESIANGVIDPLIGGLAYYATCQVRILKDNLKNLQEDETQNINNQIIYSKIKFCIKHHSSIIEFIKLYENTFSPMVFMQFSASVVVICISCLQLSMVEPFTASFFSMSIFINAVLMEIFFYCYYGTTLFEESNTLISAAYMSQWYNFDERAKKALIIFMERCKRPMKVTAGKILDLSLITFTTILRRSYSLLAVLKNY